MKKVWKRLLTLGLALLLAAAFPMTVAADVWIPPDDNVNEALLMSPYFENDCKAINAFVSNYVEANLKEYSDETPDSTVIAVTLKHLELNEGLFGSDVTKITGEDGRTYMKVSASIFETRAQKLFGRTISARNCPGYEDGSIIVSADNFGGPIRVFGSVDYLNYIGNGVYDLQFTVYYVPGGVTDEYSVPYMDIIDRGYRELGTGYAVLYFNDPAKTSFRTADFQLLDFHMDAEGIPCTDANLPMERQEQSSNSTDGPTEPEPTETEPEVTETEPARTEPEATESPEPEQTEPEQTEREQTGRDQTVIHSRSGSGSMILLIVLSVLSLALLALAVILLVFRKKE